MADLLFVYLRDAQAAADALAGTFERAGISVASGAPSPQELADCAGIVVLWSSDAARSEPFLDAVAIAAAAERTVIARLSATPLPLNLNRTPSFDLVTWNGDADDPALDQFFVTVDRLVAKARSRATAAKTPPPPQPARPDALAEEAEFWRRIRESDDPRHFEAYLSRYGKSGAFAELAQMRLSRLASEAAEPLAEQVARPAPPPPAPTQNARAWTGWSVQAPTARPAQRPLEEPIPPPPEPVPIPPPRPRAVAPAAPPPRPAPPPAPQARPQAFTPIAPPPPAPQPPPRRSAPTRLEDYAVPPPPRPQPHPEAERPVAPPAPKQRSNAPIIAVLAIVGLIGAGVGMNFLGRESEAPPVAEAPPPPSGDPRVTMTDAAPSEAVSASPDLPIDAGGDARGGSLASPQPKDAPRAGPRQVPPPRPEAAQPPAPRFDPVRPTTATPMVDPLPSAPETPRADLAAPKTVEKVDLPALAPIWERRPDARILRDLYPDRAADAGRAGRVVLVCQVLSDLRAQCGVVTETPTGFGFGAAALRAAQSLRAAPTLADGSPSPGARGQMTLVFQP
jgi:hypothetical protein